MLELLLGGSGRLTEINSFLTLRMCLFIIYLIVVAVYLITRRKLHSSIWLIVAMFLTLMIFSAINGYLNGASFADIFNDIKPLLNIFLLMYLGYSIKTINDVAYLIKLIKISSICLIVLHFVLYYIYLKYSGIAIMYSALSSGDDLNKTMFFFKGDFGFINYTGDLYLCIGFITWEQYHKNSFLKYLILFFLMISIVLTGTRGLIFSLGVAYLIKWVFLKFNYRSIVYSILGLLLIILVFNQIKDQIGDKEESDSIRYMAISQVKEKLTPLSVFIGHGFGIGVPIRPQHMEIAYLEIFNKQGIIGILYYVTVLFIVYYLYRKCPFEQGVGFLMFVIFVYFLSGTNPYINHPLGITILSISVISLIRIAGVKDPDNIKLY